MTTPLDPGRLDDGLTRDIVRIADEGTVVEELLELDGRDVLELGCGRGATARAIAAHGRNRRVVALDVDEAQLAVLRAAPPTPGLRFGRGAAEAIPMPDRSVDAVLLLRSLHHVPVAAMPIAMEEIARVLRPGGHAFVCEPLARDAFDEVLRVFHDEAAVRRRAFAAIVAAVRAGTLEAVSQTFFRAPRAFADFDAFEREVMRATHLPRAPDGALREAVAAAFARNAAADGSARFLQPLRVDLLRRPR